MRTNIVLDSKLVEEASKLTGIKTKKDLINEALKVLIRQKSRKSLLDLFGKIEFADSYNYKKMRK